MSWENASGNFNANLLGNFPLPTLGFFSLEDIKFNCYSSFSLFPVLGVLSFRSPNPRVKERPSLIIPANLPPPITITAPHFYFIALAIK